MSPRAARPSKGARPPSRFVLLTGMSGSGKSQAIRALEDLGYYAVDNLPTVLIPTLADLTRQAGGDSSRSAVVVDMRESGFLQSFPKVYRKLRSDEVLSPLLIFLDASNESLVRRFSETRRPHPLAKGRSAIEAIREERSLLRGVRRMADEIIDSSDMTVHDLRRTFMRLAGGSSPETTLLVTLLTFGFKHGLPVDADLVIDVRFLPNPHFVPTLRPLTGRSSAVRQYLNKFEATGKFLDKTTDWLRFLLPQYIDEGKSYLTIAIGCTGGRHRSVAIGEALRRRLARIDRVRLRSRHRDIATN